VGVRCGERVEAEADEPANRSKGRERWYRSIASSESLAEGVVRPGYVFRLATAAVLLAVLALCRAREFSPLDNISDGVGFVFGSEDACNVGVSQSASVSSARFLALRVADWAKGGDKRRVRCR
jgi:hypothetical protein